MRQNPQILRFLVKTNALPIQNLVVFQKKLKFFLKLILESYFELELLLGFMWC